MNSATLFPLWRFFEMEEHPQARFIVDTLAKAGFIAYYAGGWVRDFLLRHPSDDIDIATNAPPETIQALFPHTVPIGIAFGIILVLIDGHSYEVATFRQDFDYQDGRRPNKTLFATAEEDAKRRDFTINGMFYDPQTEKVIDYVGGKEDLQKKIIRAIGNPHERIKEDRLRMIRACRLSCRFGFVIEEKTREAICKHAKELFPAVAIERIVQEFEKAKNFGKLLPMLLQLHEFGLLSSIFPQLEEVSLSEITKRMAPLAHYPQEAPLIAYLLPLFPHKTEEEDLALCKQLKLSKEEQTFVSFLFSAKQKREEDADWVPFYAHPLSRLCLQILEAHLPKEQRAHFASEHGARQKELSPFIERVKNQDLVLKSDDLMKAGIPSGKTMGLLLKEGNRLAINERLTDARVVIQRLKALPLWPKE